MTRHHRIPISKGGTFKDRRYKVKVPRDQHHAWHLIAHNYEPRMIARILNLVIHDAARAGEVIDGGAIFLRAYHNMQSIPERASWWTEHEKFVERSVGHVQLSPDQLRMASEGYQYIFKGLLLNRIAHKINHVWINPDWRMVIYRVTIRRDKRSLIRRVA